MDLLDFDQVSLYFDEPLDEAISALIAEAGTEYGDEAAERLLYKAYFHAPESLVVLVALYRYNFYQHHMDEALLIATRALAVVGRRLQFPEQWEHLSPTFLGQGVMRSMGLLRFYLNLMKAAGYINLRLGRRERGRALLEKLVELDSHDRLGGKALLGLLDAENVEAA
jgi:hypothetical protein